MADIKIGDMVRYLSSEGDRLYKICGAALVLATDTDPAWNTGDLKNRSSAWIRYVSKDGFYRYRSVDICDLEPG